VGVIGHRTSGGSDLPCDLVHYLQPHAEWLSEHPSGTGPIVDAPREARPIDPGWWHKPYRDNEIMLDGAARSAKWLGMDPFLFGLHPYGWRQERKDWHRA
jgi:hypothetical protein